MATGRWARWASCGALAVWLLAGCSSQMAETRKPEVAPVAKAAEITDIRVSGSGDEVHVIVTTSAKAPFSLVQQADPPRLLLELPGTTVAAPERFIPVNRGAVTMVKPLSAGPNGGIEVYLSAEAAYDVEGRGTSVVLNVSPKAPAAAIGPAGTPAAAVEEAKPAPAPAAPANPPAALYAQAAVTTATEAPPALPAAPASAIEPAVASGPCVLETIDVDKRADGLVVTLQGTGHLRHDYFLVDGKSLVVDIAEAGNKVSPLKKKVNDAYVSQIRIGEHRQPKKFTRVVFDLKQIGEYRVDGIDNRIVVSFGAPALAAAGAGAVPGAAAPAPLNTVSEVTCRPLETATRLEIKTADKADFVIVDSGDPAKVVIEIANAWIAEKDRKSLDLSRLDLEVVTVSSFPYTKGDAQFVRVVAQLRQPVPFNAIAEPHRVLVDFQKPPAPVQAVAAPEPVPQPAPVAPTVAAVQPEAAAAPAPAGAAFTGRRLSLDFKDADVNDILRLVSEVSGLNFIAGPEVKGTVSIKLADVPWDQALDLILKTNVPQLAQIRESDNIVRITTIDKILDEEERRRRIEEGRKKTFETQQSLEPLVTKSYAISYAKAQEIADLVKESFSSERGKSLIQFDERTNTLIVQDLAGNVAEIDRLIQGLDTPTPAVLVEARIVEVADGYEQQLGVQWNLQGVKDPAHGNATNYAFPNSISVNGTQTVANTDGSTSNMLVNLPAAAATSGIGFTLGHIANTLTLDLRLSAMEEMGHTKILSNPRVMVVQNQKAVINIGSQLPIPKTDSEGNRTVEWKDVGILLEVTPQVTNDRRVFMDIKIEKSSQGENVLTTEGAMFSINSNRTETKVLIADGETTVIGGIFIQETIKNDYGVPGFSNIPLFGWLFKSKSDEQRKKELMIFLTPRLVTI